MPHYCTSIAPRLSSPEALGERFSGERPWVHCWRRRTALSLFLAFIVAGGASCESVESCAGAPQAPIQIEVGDSGSANDLITPSPSRPSPPPGRTFLGRSEDELLRIIREQKVLGARATTGSSLSMYLNLEGEDNAAFKPQTNRGQRWYGEVAAFRIGRLLNIDRIPPAATRRIRLPILRSLLEHDEEVLARLNDEGVFRGNSVRGAVMYWVPVINPSEVDRLEELEQWTGWLRQGAAIPPERLRLARQVSEMIVFDYLIGNWDRWSGSNVLFGSDNSTLLIMDNNAAFNTEFSERLRERLDAPLLQVERFSAALYRRLIGLSAEDIRDELAQETDGDGLLTEEQIDAVMIRRREIIARIDALIEEHGHDEVLCFP